MDQNFLKVTYHLGDEKVSTYFMNPLRSYINFIKDELEWCLFEEQKYPRCELRTFWIDEDFDEIQVISENDYIIFMKKCSVRPHLQVAPVRVNEKNDHQDGSPLSTKLPPAVGSYESAVHMYVECDACLMGPIKGFRYKCIQCPNYDLCQNCEAKHIHWEHMMVRMPTNNCPNVIEAYVTGRTSRRHGKRSKTSNGLSVVIDDEQGATANAAGPESAGQSAPANGKEQRHHGRKHHRRHHRTNFFSHLYDMMNDLAEGGGATAAAHAMGEPISSSKSRTSTTDTNATSVPGFATVPNNDIAAATAAHLVAQKIQKTAVQSAALAAKIAQESAIQAAKNVSEIMASTPSTSSTSASANEDTVTVGDEKEKEATKEKVDASTSPRDSEQKPNAVPIKPSPSLESFAQYIDPQYMKTGIQILNNFSDMFAKMLDPTDNIDGGEGQTVLNLRKNSTTSTKSSVSSNLNSLASDKSSVNEKLIEKEQQPNQEEIIEVKLPESDASTHVEIDDLGSDSENDSVSDSFIKLDAPKEGGMGSPYSDKSASPTPSAQTTSAQTLDKPKVMDFVQLSADLKAHIAQEAEATTTITSTTTASEPVGTTTATITNSNKPEEKRAVIVYHADQRINNAVHAMMAMGFSNEGAWLTQLLESVNGNIPEALDLMSAAQRGGSR